MGSRCILRKRKEEIKHKRKGETHFKAVGLPGRHKTTWRGRGGVHGPTH
jgi:hypothetical protein